MNLPYSNISWYPPPYMGLTPCRLTPRIGTGIPINDQPKGVSNMFPVSHRLWLCFAALQATMVVLAAAVLTKNGKPLISRQFVEMSRIRIEGLLAAFPKLMGTGKQYTYLETDTVRYVYQPIENLFLGMSTQHPLWFMDFLHQCWSQTEAATSWRILKHFVCWGALCLSVIWHSVVPLGTLRARFGFVFDSIIWPKWRLDRDRGVGVKVDIETSSTCIHPPVVLCFWCDLCLSGGKISTAWGAKKCKKWGLLVLMWEK